ncbi:MAG: hypothetical protein SPK50_06465 [Mobiluncus porci]|uniref:hypothetical protein n=1 Tax=Mobiluncus TaxID=2050 RepID=UPI0023EFB9B7|nr:MULTISPECIES: hypothetical protein [Mobiluncus]MCI6585193.1 hypothetical protein [Mobiluncus sp.]MDD7540631.1 hypothetical protein [Mobiluncus porci]MDY5748756.1 hypothetical protein [Mobiluncus porci]
MTRLRLRLDTMRRFRFPKAECGGGMAILVVFFGLLLLAFGFAYVIKLSAIGDQMDRLQVSADAAALAWADYNVEQMHDLFTDDINGSSPSWSELTLGKANAGTFAQKNDAKLISGSPINQNEYRVMVQSNTKFASGNFEKETAVSTLGAKVSSCDTRDLQAELDDKIEAYLESLAAAATAQSEEGGDSTTATFSLPEEDPDIFVSGNVNCGEIELDVELHWKEPNVVLTSQDDIAKQFDPHLVG